MKVKDNYVAKQLYYNTDYKLKKYQTLIKSFFVLT